MNTQQFEVTGHSPNPKPLPSCSKPEDRLRVIYQGGSIAALASASLLADAGYEVILFEKDKDPLALDDKGAMDYAGGRVRCIDTDAFL